MFNRILIQLKNPKIFLYNMWHFMKNFLFSKVLGNRLIWTFNNGIKFYQDQLIGFQILRYRKHNLHEPDVNKTFNSVLKKYDGEGVLIDAGAAGGYYSILAKKLAPDIQVYAFNPHPTFVKAMDENLKLNRIHGVEQVQKAISNKVGRCNIEDGWGGKITQGNSVEMTTLDKFITGRKIKSVFLLKVDVQGEEFNVLLGAKNSFDKIAHIILETHTEKSHRQCKHFLMECGRKFAETREDSIYRGGGLLVSD